ncbi:hypothetical protein PHLCEN_2v6073 [Hermanssonia centrifuga]|uniref:Uncharacterized protein n=1 Tax=Hermanssonia centrifuga TaxID=98765 RepID=A0A2R6P0K1_9APHY|nr:hypothetical protein PHLCEN_2v6073 [Hermanssonia centrifuga]
MASSLSERLAGPVSLGQRHPVLCDLGGIQCFTTRPIVESLLPLYTEQSQFIIVRRRETGDSQSWALSQCPPAEVWIGFNMAIPLVSGFALPAPAPA